MSDQTESKPSATSQPVTPLMGFDALHETGILWFINRVAFHAHGRALAVERDDDGNVTGWFMCGDGLEPIGFDSAADDGGFERWKAFRQTWAAPFSP